jgi:hypothetical protein
MTEPAKRPWFRFYPSDHRGDAKLRMCSLAARGLWIELCSVMHEAEPYGHLLVGGNVPKLPQIAILVGAPQAQVAALLGELELQGVFSRTAQQVIFSRRMVRDKLRDDRQREIGKRGGNPHLMARPGADVKPTPMSTPGPRVNPEDIPHMPEARDSEAPDGASGAVAPLDPAKLMFDAGRRLLTRHGVAAKQAGSMLGAWRRDYGDAALIAAIGAAVREEAQQPAEFIVGCLRRHGHGARRLNPELDAGDPGLAALREFVRGQPRHAGLAAERDDAGGAG